MELDRKDCDVCGRSCIWHGLLHCWIHTGRLRADHVAVVCGERGENAPADRPMMECGCIANATQQGFTDAEAVPACAIHGATEVADMPDLEGRVATCSSCRLMVASNPRLPFFQYRGPGDAKDSYYCGCRGWS